MSKTHEGSVESHPRPAHQPVSGLFFLCSFLLLIGIPASGYVEIWAKACLHGSSPAAAMLESGGMTMQQPNYHVPNTITPHYFPQTHLTGEEIAGDSETGQ